MNILAAFIFFTRLPFWRIREVPAAFVRMAHGRHHGRSTLVERTDPPLLRCRIVGTCRPVIDHRCPTRRRVGRFLRWIRRRYEPGADSLHHERFAYRQLRCHRVDFLLPSSMESFDVAPPLLRMYYIDCRRHDKQADLITNHQLPALRTERRRKQGQSSI